MNSISEARPNTAQQFTYEDLRDWIEQADRLGELKRVEGASWERDIGLAAEVVIREDDGPAVLFDKVPGSPDGYRVLINVFGGSRRNMTLGFPDHLTKQELSEGCFESFVKERKTIPYKIVKNGSVFENILTGDDIDLMKFPTPMWHPEDGGRYLGTGTYTVTRDPDEGWLNCGAYRAMVHDSRSVGCFMVTGKHGYVHRNKYWDKGEPCPVVMVVGGEPIAFFNGGAEAPYGTFELDIVGGIRNKAVECVVGDITGLPFPANAEIVLEGHLHPDRVKDEGPFGEWTGYYASGQHPEPVLEVEAIYHRNDPIILGVPPMGQGSDEMARYRAVLRSAMLKQNLADAGVPDVTGVWCHEIGASRLLHGVSIKQRYPGHSKQAGHIAAQCQAANYANRFIIVVDDDIDVTDLEELIWAMCTRCDPATTIDIVKGAWTSPADPRLTPEQKASGDITNSRAIIDACKPFHWKDDYAPVNAPSPEVLREAQAKFGYLLK
ncbi:MAG: UbiD family decarboxylase [Pseudomonadota bacterium]|nr:UbiD family decarboxylase [Pseudomonadota bacterium]